MKIYAITAYHGYIFAAYGLVGMVLGLWILRTKHRLNRWVK